MRIRSKSQPASADEHHSALRQTGVQMKRAESGAMPDARAFALAQQEHQSRASKSAQAAWLRERAGVMSGSADAPAQRAVDTKGLRGKRAVAQREKTGAQLQGKVAPVQRIVDDAPLQRTENEAQSQRLFTPGLRAQQETRPNDTGMPDRLKSGVESLSGMSMNHVKVHYNSGKPAQLNAHAYAQGSEIYIGPGQEQHLPHEAWHVVQQAQDRVRPTMQMQDDIPVNDDAGLEREADVMGARALERPADPGGPSALSPVAAGAGAAQFKRPHASSAPVVQRILEIEGERYDDEAVIRDNAIDAAGATAASIEGLVHAATDPEVIRFDSWAEANAHYDHADLLDPLALAHDPDDAVEIPALIHFIWMGNPPSAGAIENILRWAARARNTAWRIFLWTDGGVNVGDWAPQLERLSGAVEVHQIRPMLDPRLSPHYEEAVDNPAEPRAFNMASDMARYSILDRLGGVYADVDLGPGGVDLTVIPVLSILDIPVLAPQVRDRAALREQLSPDQLAHLDLSQQVELAATKAYRNNQLNNNLLVTGAHSEFMYRLINNVAAKIRSDRGRGGRREWADNAALITGPQTVITTMFEMLGMDAQRLIDAMDPATLNNWSRLQWLTAESESQHYDSGSKEGKTAPKKNDKKCFLTTACVEVMGLEDDCPELACLRAFRDGYMSRQADGPALIAEYYRIAPGIVAALRDSAQFEARAIELYQHLVLGSIALIRTGRNREALEHYRAIVRTLEAQCRESAPESHQERRHDLSLHLC